MEPNTANLDTCKCETKLISACLKFRYIDYLFLLQIMNGMSLIGVPPPPTPLRAVSSPLEYTVLHGLRAAIEALSEITEVQQDKIEKSNDGSKILNRGRVICITSARDNDSMKRLEDIFLSVLNQQNKLCGSER